MTSIEPASALSLTDSLEAKIKSLLEDMHAEGWNTAEVLGAMADLVTRRQREQQETEESEPRTMQEGFVSDGNEG